MPNVKLSVVLAVFNEEANLRQCLDSVKEITDDIVISDGGSKDQTLAIAKEYKVKIFHLPNQENFHINKNNAIDYATGDWILQLDADEVVSPELAQEIEEVINKNGNVNGYWVNRRNWFLDRFLTKGGQYPDPTLRLYRRSKGRLPGKDVHEQAMVDGEVGHLKHDLLHYRDTSFEKYLQGFNRYSSLIASQMKDAKTHLSPINAVNYLLIRPVWTFLGIYLRHRGYVDGFPGFVFALYSGLIHPVAYIKYWQTTKYPSNTSPQPSPKLRRGGSAAVEGEV